MIWEPTNRAVVALNIGTALVVLLGEYALARFLAVVCLICAVSSYINSPSWRLELHWRSLALNVANSIIVAACCTDIGYGRSLSDPIWSPSFSTSIAIILVILSVATAILYYFLPIPTECDLKGPYKYIGTRSFNIDVPMQHETTAEGLGDSESASTTAAATAGASGNQIAVQCWFPIETPRSFLERYFPSRAVMWTSGHPDYQIQESLDLLLKIAHNTKMNPTIVRHLALARTNSVYQGSFDNLIGSYLTSMNAGQDTATAAATVEKLPVAVYSHGLYGWRSIHHTACENLASRGFFVIACDHNPDCMMFRPLGKPAAPFDFSAPPNASDTEERHFFMQGLKRRVQQLQGMIACITRPGDGGGNTAENVKTNNGNEFESILDRLDTSQLHIWGHSYGGGTVCSFGSQEARVASVVTLDSWMYPVPDSDRTSGLRNPSASLINLSAEMWQWGKYQAPFRADFVKHSQSKRKKKLPYGSERSDPINDTNAQDNSSSACFFDMVIRHSDHQNYVDVNRMAAHHLLHGPSMLGKNVDCFQLSTALDEVLPAFFLRPMTCDGSRTRNPTGAAYQHQDTTCTGSPNSDRQVHIKKRGATERDEEEIAGSVESPLDDASAQSASDLMIPPTAAAAAVIVAAAASASGTFNLPASAPAARNPTITAAEETEALIELLYNGVAQFPKHSQLAANPLNSNELEETGMNASRLSNEDLNGAFANENDHKNLLSKDTIRFLRQFLVPVHAMPPTYSDNKAFDSVQQNPI